jgi:hypothetical protein
MKLSGTTTRASLSMSHAARDTGMRVTARRGQRSTAARKAPNTVGIWHETYLVDRAESIYFGMPAFGLAAATSSVPVARRGETATERLGARQAA